MKCWNYNNEAYPPCWYVSSTSIYYVSLTCYKNMISPIQNTMYFVYQELLTNFLVSQYLHFRFNLPVNNVSITMQWNSISAVSLFYRYPTEPPYIDTQDLNDWDLLGYQPYLPPLHDLHTIEFHYIVDLKKHKHLFTVRYKEKLDLFDELNFSL